MAECKKKEEDRVKVEAAECQKKEQDECITKEIEERRRQKEERKIFLEVKRTYSAEIKNETPKNVTFADDCKVIEEKKVPDLDNSHALDDTLEYTDPPEPVLNLCTPELKAMEYSMENNLLEEYDKQQCLVIDMSGCLGDETECTMCSSIPPPSQMKTFFMKN